MSARLPVPAIDLMAGDVFSGSFGYDSEAVAKPAYFYSEPGLFEGASYPANIFQVTVGDQTWEVRDELYVTVINDEPTVLTAFDHFDVEQSFGLGRLSEVFFEISDSDEPLNLLSSNRLPTSLDDLRYSPGQDVPNFQFSPPDQTWKIESNQLISLDLRLVPEPIVSGCGWLVRFAFVLATNRRSRLR